MVLRLTALVLILAGVVVACSSPATPTGTPARPTASIAPSSGTSSPGSTPTETATPSPSPDTTPTPTPTPKPTSPPTPTPPASSGALPTCAYKDVLTTHRAYADWAVTLVDTIYRLPSTYVPSDLVNTSKAGLTSGFYVRGLVIDDLTTMAADARAAGARLAVESAFRSYKTQIGTFDYWVNLAGYEAALLASARPGHSEHQLGTSIDFKSYGGSAPWNSDDWGTTAAGAWMATNAWKYGWVMSYPPDSSPALTCYKYEPWHFRYVGRETAAAMHDSGQPPRQWLWEHGAI